MKITQAQYATVQRLAERAGGRFVLNEGITIQRDPPKAMVKLAREIVAPFAQDAASGAHLPGQGE